MNTPNAFALGVLCGADKNLWRFVSAHGILKEKTKGGIL